MWGMGWGPGWGQEWSQDRGLVSRGLCFFGEASTFL